jgi:tetratricopeptide (TPR) repeat protein
VLTALALVELRIEGPDSCIRYLMQALEHHPEFPPALFNLGVVYMDWLEEREKGEGYLREFLGTDATGPMVREARVRLGLPVKKQASEEEETEMAAPQEGQAVVEPEPGREADAEALFERARSATEDGDDKQALNLYLQAAGQARRDGDVELRRRVLKASVEAYFDQPRTHFAYARFLEEQDEHKAALVAYKQAAVLSPEWLEAQAALARTALAAGEYDAALIALRKEVELDKENADALWQLAQLYEENLELPERALQAYYRFQQSFPGDTRALQAGEKVRDLRTAQEEPAAEEQPPPAEEEDEEELETIQDVRQELKEAVRVRRAAHNLPARRLNIRKPRVRNTRAAIQAFNRGTIYQSREDWDRAIYYYRRALENDDTFVQAFYNLGAVYRMNGDLDLAKDAYLNALQLRPDMVNARYNLAIVYWELKQYTAAEDQAGKVLEAEPENAYAHYVLGLIYATDPRTHAAAREHYREFLRLAPEDAAAPMVEQWLNAH